MITRTLCDGLKKTMDGINPAMFGKKQNKFIENQILKTIEGDQKWELKKPNK